MTKRLFAIALTGALLATGAQILPSGTDGPVEIVGVAASPANLKALAAMRADVLSVSDGRVHVVATPEDLGRLSRLGIAFAVETARFAPAHPAGAAAAGGLNGDYHSYLELDAELEAIRAAHPGLVEVRTIGTSLEGRAIRAVKVGTSAGGRAGVLFLGCHHAREWISVEVPLLLARYLAENAGSDPAVSDVLARGDAWIVPLVNPDGLEYSINVYRYWRKNRRANPDGSFGVDLNRNYGYMWGYDDEGSSPSPVSETYRGASAFSEPETRAVRDLFLGLDIRAVISYHSYSQDILYPWGYADVATDKDGWLGGLAKEMAALIRAVNGRDYACGRAASTLYVTNGDTTDWTFAASGAPSYTIELPPVDVDHGGFFNAEAEIEGLFRENLPAMLHLALRSLPFLPDDVRAVRALERRPAGPLTKGRQTDK